MSKAQQYVLVLAPPDYREYTGRWLLNGDVLPRGYTFAKKRGQGEDEPKTQAFKLPR